MFDVFNHKLKRKYSDIFVISIVILDNNKLLIKYLINQEIEVDKYKGFFEFSYIENNVYLIDSLQLGKWTKVELGYDGNILHILEPKKQASI